MKEIKIGVGDLIQYQYQSNTLKDNPFSESIKSLYYITSIIHLSELPHTKNKDITEHTITNNNNANLLISLKCLSDIHIMNLTEREFNEMINNNRLTIVSGIQ